MIVGSTNFWTFLTIIKSSSYFTILPMKLKPFEKSLKVEGFVLVSGTDKYIVKYLEVPDGSISYNIRRVAKDGTVSEPIPWFSFLKAIATE